MKTKTILLLCLFSGICLSQLSAQNSNSTGTYTLQGWFGSSYWSPVYCGDNQIDLLEGGKIMVHYVVHRKEGMRIWRIDQLRGEVTSTKEPYEVFRIVEMDKYDFVEGAFSTLTWKYNLLGDKGSHYIGILIQDLITGEITIGPTVCN